MAKPALRTSLIWHDEVMADVVSERPQAITIGPFDDATFITPEIGLPRDFAIVRPGSRGNVLALGEHMRGTVCIGGVEQDVASLVRGSDTPGFFATAIGGLDWGVIELDASGMYKVFFQFVGLDDDGVPKMPKPVLVAAGAGFALSGAVLSAVFLLAHATIGEALFRGFGLAALALGAAALVRWVLKQDTESRASLAFSTVLHAVLLFATYRIAIHEEPDPRITTRDLTASYIPAHLTATDPPKPKPAIAPTIMTTAPPVVDPVQHHDVTIPKPKIHVQPTIKGGGGGDPDKHGAGPKGLDDDAARAIGGTIGNNNTHGIEQLAAAGNNGGGDEVPAQGPRSTHGGGTGSGGTVGQGTDHGGGMDTGPIRSVCMGAGCKGNGHGPTIIPTTTGPSDPPDTGLTMKDVDDVIKKAQRRLQFCYQREVDHDKSLGGSINVKFVIEADGSVSSSKVTENHMHGETVGDCVATSIAMLHFPPKGGAVVNYPFVFNLH